MANQDVLRISRVSRASDDLTVCLHLQEITGIQNGNNLSLAVDYDESDVRQTLALIIGAPETPYAYGFFEFDIKFPKEYPLQPPSVLARTTNNGRTRFNPNIYAGGKVCLSILGTWPGREDEEWSAAQGLESVLISIQSLMSDNPFQNEPGYEETRDSEEDLREAYRAKIRHESLRIAVIEPLESILRIQPDGSSAPTVRFELPLSNTNEYGNAQGGTVAEGASVLERTQPERSKPFADLKKRRFLWYFENYRKVIEDNMPKHAAGKDFVMMPFEAHQNGMMGRFEYEKLSDRLDRIKLALDKESEDWAKEGTEACEQELNSAHAVQHALMEFKPSQIRKGLHSIDVNLLDNNPFVWMITYFGRPGTNLEGGIFQIRLSISPRFPEEQPRVRMETKIFHHRVATDGTLCYLPENPRDLKHHVEAIVLTLEEIVPPYDPRTIVNVEAARLFWGNEEDKKKYERAQRKSAQRSTEDSEQ